MTFRELFEQWIHGNADTMTMPKYENDAREKAHMFRKLYESSLCIPDVSHLQSDVIEERYTIIRYGGGNLRYRFAIYDKTTHWKRYLSDDECAHIGLNMRNGRSDWSPYINANGSDEYIAVRNRSDAVASDFYHACIAYAESFKPLIEQYTPEGRQAKSFYSEYIQSPAWATKRRQVLIRDDYRCFDCGTSTRLQVHHVNYKNLGNEPLEDLITLCSTCHTARHNESRGIAS